MEKTYYWIVNIIESCRDDFQFSCVDKLIDLYFDKYKDENTKIELMFLRATKWNAIHDIIEPTLNK